MRFLTCCLLALCLSGCAWLDRLQAPVDLDDAQAKVALVDSGLATAKARIEGLEADLAVARTLAEQSGSEAALATVTALEALYSKAAAAVPVLENASAQAHASLTELQAGGQTSPLWYVLLTLGAPYLLPVLRPLVGSIPAVGPLLSSAIGAYADSHWSATATNGQKQADAVAQAAQAKLAQQVAITNKALALLPPEHAAAIIHDAALAG